MKRERLALPRIPDSIDTFVGRRIANRRSALGLSQSALATRLGISFQQIQKYESASNRVSASRLHQIAIALALPVRQFFPDTPLDGASPDNGRAEALPFMTASPEGRIVANQFASIESQDARRAVATIVGALAAR
ncbi:MAG TPA: helix-turn-helix transcriptional regulator [Brevundimonas sp.]|jgi:transcriptional regulator with XRE-family HTH domain